MSIDLEGVLAAVSGSEPAGPDLGYDPSFAALERSAQGKPQQQIGTTVVPGEEPDWKAVQRQSTELLAKTRDLRISVYYFKALIRTAGWAGLAEGLTLLRGLIERYWDGGLHPRLDPEDDNDPTIRVNVLKELSAPDVLAVVRALPLCISPVFGPIGLAHVESASGDGAAPVAPNSLTMAAIEGSFADAPIEALRATEAIVRAAVETLSGIEVATTEKVGPEHAPSLERLSGLLRKALAVVGGAVARRMPADAPGEVEGAAHVNGGGRRAGGGFAMGEISSREDVVRALDKICAYYAKNEPSSPIPILLERSKKLVTMTFVEIVKELVPDASSQLANLKGRE
jgi:type VI secretion system protein ImpA